MYSDPKRYGFTTGNIIAPISKQMQVAMAGDGDAMAMPTGEHLLTLAWSNAPQQQRPVYLWLLHGNATDANGCTATAVTIIQPNSAYRQHSNRVNCNGNVGATASGNGGLPGILICGIMDKQHQRQQVCLRILLLRLQMQMVVPRKCNFRACKRISASAAVMMIVLAAAMSATVSSTGGTSPYSYLWNNGVQQGKPCLYRQFIP